MADLLALDIGTTAVKAALVDRSLTVRASATAPVDTRRAGPAVEQDPGQWWYAACAAVAELAGGGALDDLDGLAVTGQMQDLVCVRGDRHAGPALLYSDHRAEAEHAALVARLGEDEWFRITRNLQDLGNVAAKWLWLAEHEPDRLDGVDRLLLGAHSYVAFRATGQAACDPTTATTTGLFDAAAGRWSEEVAAAARLDTDLLPALQDPAAPLGALTPDAAADLGLSAGIPVFHSAGDAGTSTVGVGAGTGGRYVYLGTSGWLAASLPGDVTPRRELFTLAHPIQGHAIQVGPMLSVGACVDWALSALAGDGDHDLLEADVAAVSGPSGLLFLPYLAGERSPFHDPAARGAFVGLGMDTTRGHLLKAVLEGVALSLATIDDLIGHQEHRPLLRLCGGGSRSSQWCQVFADVFGEPTLRVPSMEHVGVLGAARLAGPALGWPAHTDPDEADGAVFQPNPETTGVYRELRTLHRGAYPQLRDIVHRLPGASRT
jgi:xylulokinase